MEEGYERTQGYRLARRSDLIVNTEAVGRYLSDPISEFERSFRKADGSTGSTKSEDTLIDVEDSGSGDGNEGEQDLRMRGGEGGLSEEEGDEEWKYREWKGEGIEVLWFKDLDHAQVFDKPSTRRRVIGCIRKYCEDI